MKVESISECSPWSILQYFWPAFSDNWSWKLIFGLFESGQFSLVLLYNIGLTDAVFNVSLDPKSCDLAVTGGQDDKAFVWRVSTGEVIFECLGKLD